MILQSWIPQSCEQVMIPPIQSAGWPNTQRLTNLRYDLLLRFKDHILISFEWPLYYGCDILLHWLHTDNQAVLSRACLSFEDNSCPFWWYRTILSTASLPEVNTTVGVLTLLNSRAINWWTSTASVDLYVGFVFEMFDKTWRGWGGEISQYSVTRSVCQFSSSLITPQICLCVTGLLWSIVISRA